MRMRLTAWHCKGACPLRRDSCKGKKKRKAPATDGCVLNGHEAFGEMSGHVHSFLDSFCDLLRPLTVRTMPEIESLQEERPPGVPLQPEKCRHWGKTLTDLREHLVTPEPSPSLLSNQPRTSNAAPNERFRKKEDPNPNKNLTPK